MATDNYWTRRMNRRRVLAGGGTAAIGIGAFALTGCGDDGGGIGDGEIMARAAGRV